MTEKPSPCRCFFGIRNKGRAHMEYLFQICYTVKSNNSSIAFPEISEQLDQLTNIIESFLPEEYSYNELYTEKTSSSLIKLEEGNNCLRCEICGDYVSLPNNNALSAISEGIQIGEKILCKHCAWQQIRDTGDGTSRSKQVRR